MLDIYVACVSSTHNVCAPGHYVAIVSTIAESDGDPLGEIKYALNLLGPIADKFVSVTDIFHPISDGTNENLFISKSLDATSHFETVVDDVKCIFKRFFGRELDLTKKPKKAEEVERMAMGEN